MVDFDQYNEWMIRDLEHILIQLSNNPRKVKLRFVVDIKDAAWISHRIYEDIERGIYSAELLVKKSEHSVEMTLTLAVMVAVAASIASSTTKFLLEELRDYMIRKKKGRERTKRKKYNKMR